ncbi:endo alpha-1,4 polygalactosaminidase [Paenibacillus thermotolerans]|uniref:endo alpha-1,4 polygalactosaminidase n=1 Tax=Paenibacillus thermotolerans TaxID=3027807 RepID=UPI0023678940|nr:MULTISPECIES: endo alpha-1,4 polygalactosaminidase [unclassified Paenibacillus]
MTVDNGLAGAPREADGQDGGRFRRFQAANSFAVFYGHGEAEALSDYDIAIVEPQGQTKDTVAAMSRAGTLVIAYVSITEVPDYDPLKPLLQSADYLTVGSEIVRNAEYGTSLADLRSRNWTNMLLHRIGGYLRVGGYDGIFMDTISNVEWPALPAGVRAEQQAAAVEFVRRLRGMFPEHIMIQNNGFETLCDHTAPYINAVCWENPDFVKPETYRWHEAVRGRIGRLASGYGIRVLALLEQASMSEPGLEAAAYWAEKERFLLYRSPGQHYLQVEGKL